MYSVGQPSDERLDQKVDERMTENHLPGQYLDIALTAGQYLDIALEAGQYKIYCPAKAFDLPTQSGIYIMYIYLIVNLCIPKTMHIKTHNSES